MVHQRSLIPSGCDCKDPRAPWGSPSGCNGWAHAGSQAHGHTPRREPRDQRGVSVGLVSGNQTCRSQSRMHCGSPDALLAAKGLCPGVPGPGWAPLPRHLYPGLVPPCIPLLTWCRWHRPGSKLCQGSLLTGSFRAVGPLYPFQRRCAGSAGARAPSWLQADLWGSLSPGAGSRRAGSLSLQAPIIPSLSPETDKGCEKQLEVCAPACTQGVETSTSSHSTLMFPVQLHNYPWRDNGGGGVSFPNALTAAFTCCTHFKLSLFKQLQPSSAGEKGEAEKAKSLRKQKPLPRGD